MIYTDTDGALTVEYGHGSVMGFAADNNIYILVSTDPHPIGESCKNFETLVGKPNSELNPSVRFVFHKKESLDILIDDLTTIRKGMEEEGDDRADS